MGGKRKGGRDVRREGEREGGKGERRKDEQKERRDHELG